MIKLVWALAVVALVLVVWLANGYRIYRRSNNRLKAREAARKKEIIQ